MMNRWPYGCKRPVSLTRIPPDLPQVSGRAGALTTRQKQSPLKAQEQRAKRTRETLSVAGAIITLINLAG